MGAESASDLFTSRSTGAGRVIGDVAIAAFSADGLVAEEFSTGGEVAKELDGGAETGEASTALAELEPLDAAASVGGSGSSSKFDWRQ